MTACTSTETAVTTKPNVSVFRPPMTADIVRPTTQEELYNNWVATQALLEKWQSYAINVLEPLI